MSQDRLQLAQLGVDVGRAQRVFRHHLPEAAREHPPGGDHQVMRLGGRIPTLLPNQVLIRHRRRPVQNGVEQPPQPALACNL